MKTLLRECALNPRYYDRATTICLIVGVSAAFVYERGVLPVWLSYAVAGTAAIVSLSLYFYRRMANSVPTASRPSDDSSHRKVVRHSSVDAVGRPVLWDEAASDLQLAAYYTLERQLGIKVIDRAVKPSTYAVLPPRPESYLSGIRQAQASHLFPYMALSHALKHSSRSFPTVDVKQKSSKKPATDTSILWVDDFFDRSPFEQHGGLQHVTS